MAAPLANFPLPRELRNEIYAYLLDTERAEEVAEDTGSSIPDHQSPSSDTADYEGPRTTYSFTTGIIAINREIGAEAQAYLDSHGRFVRVRYDVPGFHVLRAMTDLPVIADVTDKRMEQHILSIRIRYIRVDTANSLNELSPAGNDKGVIVIALKHLPKLCDTLRFLGVARFPPVPTVASVPDEALSVLCPGSDAETQQDVFQIGVIVNTKTAKATRAQISEQSFVLDCLQVVRVSEFDLSLFGFDDRVKMQETRSRMAPSLVFPKAFVLDYVDVLRQFQNRAAALAASGHLIPAYHRYSALVLYNKQFGSNIVEDVDNLTDAGLQALEDPLDLMISTAFHSVFAQWALALRHHEVKRMIAAMSEVFEAQHPMRMTPRMHSKYEHLSSVTMIHAVAFAQSPPSAQAALEKLQAHLGELEAIRVGDEWVHHDVVVLRTFLSSFLKYLKPSKRKGGSRSADKRQEDLRAMVIQLSFWTMPFRTYDPSTDPGVSVTARPQDIVGWEDRAHLAKLTKADKSVVHELQQSMDLPLSRFG